MLAKSVANSFVKKAQKKFEEKRTNPAAKVDHKFEKSDTP